MLIFTEDFPVSIFKMSMHSFHRLQKAAGGIPHAGVELDGAWGGKEGKLKEAQQ